MTSLATWSSDPPLEKALFIQYVTFVLFGLTFLWKLNVAGRPVAHGDRKLGSKHKEAEAERVLILERLNSGSKLAADGLLKRGDDLALLGADQLSDVEKEPLRRSSDEEAAAKVATVSLSTTGGFRLPFQAYELMKKIGKEAVRGEGGTDDSFVCSSDKALMQSEVELHEGLFDRLKDLVKLPYFAKYVEEAKSLKDTKPPSGRVCTPLVQVDNWAVLKASAEGVDLLRLPVDKVPAVLHAEYAAGLLTITGLNLEDADIYISAENAYYTVKLKVWRFAKGTKSSWRSPQWVWPSFSDTEEDVATVPFQLAWTDMETVFIYATKKVQLGGDGESVEATSKAVRVVDSFWMTVLGLWLPAISIWIFTLYSFRGLFMSPYFPIQEISYISPFYVPFFTLLLLRPPGKRFVEFVKFHVETLAGGIGQGILVFYNGFRSLKGPKIEFPASERPKIPPPPPPSVSRRPPAPVPAQTG